VPTEQDSSAAFPLEVADAKAIRVAEADPARGSRLR